LNSQPWQVVGIAPPRLTAPFAQVQIFAPRVFEVGGLTPIQVQNGAGYAQPIGRLKPGVSLAQARDDLASIARASRERFPTRLDANNAMEPRMFVEALVGNLRQTFNALNGAVAFVLLIACANAAALFLSRLTARHREIAVRQSLGATRGRIISQFITESFVFSSVAGVLGVLLALWALSAVQSLVASQLPPNTVLTMNLRALVFTALTSVLTALLVGLVPAMQASRAEVVEALKDNARGSSSARGGVLRGALIVGQVALSVVLLVGSSLLLASFIKLQRTAPGFEPADVATAFVGVPQARYPTPAQQARFFDEVVERLRTEPGIAGAAAAVGIPLSGFNPRSPYSVAGRPVLPLPQRPLANLDIVSDDYFSLMRIPIVAGRTFGATDMQTTPGVCVINESFARRLFSGGSPLGQVLLRGRDANIRVEIVGVVGDVKSNGLNAPAPDEIYFPMRQIPSAGMGVLARTAAGAAAQLQSAIRVAVAAVDRDQAISAFGTLEATIANSLGVQRIVTSLTAVFAGLALILSAVGLYSVVAYAVSRRTSEIGIRMALGARRGQVVALVMGSGLQLVAIGLVLGLAAAAGTARLIRTLLYEVRPLDPAIYAAVAALFTTVAALACLLPSLRASRIDPLVALRAE
jgi:predicted permease